MIKEIYELIEIEIVAFASEDIITESNELPMMPACATENS